MSIKLIDLLSKWLVNEYPDVKWVTDYNLDYITAYYESGTSSDECATIWIDINDSPDVGIEWWFSRWEYSIFSVTDPMFFDDIKKHLDKILPLAMSYITVQRRRSTP